MGRERYWLWFNFLLYFAELVGGVSDEAYISGGRQSAYRELT